MAKKKINEELVIPVLYTPPSFYVYYDNKTGQIFSVTNEKTDRYEYGFEAKLEEVENLLNGSWQFKDYVVSYKKIDDRTVLCISEKDNNDYSFRNNVFEWITQSDNESDLTVVWDYENKSWHFKLKQGLAEYYKHLLTPSLVFFVTLEDDFDFLIRTIILDMDMLLRQDIQVPFDSDIESKIEKISISSKLVFNSYSLKVAHE